MPNDRDINEKLHQLAKDMASAPSAHGGARYVAMLAANEVEECLHTFSHSIDAALAGRLRVLHGSLRAVQAVGAEPATPATGWQQCPTCGGWTTKCLCDQQPEPPPAEPEFVITRQSGLLLEFLDQRSGWTPEPGLAEHLPRDGAVEYLQHETEELRDHSGYDLLLNADAGMLVARAKDGKLATYTIVEADKA